MGYNFPNSPTLNQTFTPSGGPTFVWNGVAWNAVTQGMPVTVYMSDTAPTSPAPGQLWWNSTTGNLSVFYADADSTQWVQVSGNLSSTAPNDGGEYVMRNGVWRLSKQSFDMAGKSQQDIQVPTWGPTQVRFSYNLFCNSVTQLWARASVDGTTFPSATTDWYWGGWTHNSTTGAFGNITWAGLGAMYLTGNIGATSVPAIGELVFGLTKIAGQTFNGKGRGYTYDTNAIVHYDALYYANVFVGASTLPLKTFRFGSSPVFAFASGKIVAEWLE